MHRRNILQGAGAIALAGTALRSAAAPQPVSEPEGDKSPAYEWTPLPFGGGGFVNGFVFHPREKGLLYARSDIGGIYRFDPAATRWIPLLDGLSKANADLMGVLSMAIDPDDPNRVYAACGMYTADWARKAALLVSDDRGDNWRIQDLDIRLGANEGGRGTGERLQVDPHQTDILLLGTSRDGLLKSSNRGQSFSRLDFAPRHVSLVLFDPDSAPPGGACRTIWVGSHDQPGLHVSNDGGRSFTRETGAPDQVPQHAVIARDRTLYVTFARGPDNTVVNPGSATAGGVWKRDRDGRWSEITPLKPSAANTSFAYSGIDVDRRAPGRILVSTIERWGLGDDLYLSEDGGANWSPLSNQSRHDARAWPWLSNSQPGQDRMGHWISDLKFDPFDGNHVVYGTGYGLWMTRNLGRTTGSVIQWDFAVSNMELNTGLELRSPTGGAALLAGLGQAGGAAWDNVEATPKAGLFAPLSESTLSVDFAELNPAIVVRTAEGSRTGGYVSADGAASWRAFGAPPLPVGGGAGVAGAGQVAVSSKGNFIVWAPDKQAALTSRDRGRTWKECGGWPSVRDRSLKPVADRHVDGVFYVFDPARGELLASIDGGQTFSPSITGLPRIETWQSAQLVSAPGKLRDLWLALPAALAHFDGADQPMKVLRTVVEPWGIALGKGSPDGKYHSLYVWGQVQARGASRAGLFRSDDAGATFERIDDNRHRYGSLTSLAADPLAHGVVYLAPHGRGLVVGKPRHQG